MSTSTNEIFRGVKITELEDHCDDSDFVYIPNISDDEEIDNAVPLPPISEAPDSMTMSFSETPNLDDEFSSQEMQDREGLQNFDGHDEMWMSQEVVSPSLPERLSLETTLVSDFGSLGQDQFVEENGRKSPDSDRTATPPPHGEPLCINLDDTEVEKPPVARGMFLNSQDSAMSDTSVGHVTKSVLSLDPETENIVMNQLEKIVGKEEPTEKEEEAGPSNVNESSPSVNQISNDHDYLYRKLAQQTSADKDSYIRSCFEAILKASKEGLEEGVEPSKNINEIAILVDNLISTQVAPEMTVLEEIPGPSAEYFDPEEAPLISNVIKEEYEAVELEPNNPHIDENTMEYYLPSDTARDSKICGLREFGSLLTNQAESIVDGGKDKVGEILQKIRSELRNLEVAFECRSTRDFEGQVSKRELNEAAKMRLLADAATSEEEKEDSENRERRKKSRRKTPSPEDPQMPDSLNDSVQIANEPVLTQEEVEENKAFDEMFSWEPQISLEEMTAPEEDQKTDKKEDSDSDSDPEIRKLMDLASLERRQKVPEPSFRRNVVPKPKPKKDTVLEEVLTNGINGHGDSSGSESSEGEITEAQFLHQHNEMIKQQLLQSSDEEESSGDLLSDTSEAKDSEALEMESSSDESDDLVGRFIQLEEDKKQRAKEIEEQEADAEEEEEEEEEVKPKPSKKGLKRRKSSLDSSGTSNRKRQRNSKDQPESDSDEDVLDLSMFNPTNEKIQGMDEEPGALSSVIAPEILAPLTTASHSSSTTPAPPDEDDDHISLSSESEDDSTKASGKTPRHRKILSDDQLAKTTKEAELEEANRIKRLKNKQEVIAQFVKANRKFEHDLLLDYDIDEKQPIRVDPDIASKLKEHQKEGIKFMYDCCYGDISKIDKFPGSGCILAHCMGLGKTLQLIALLHTVIQYPKLQTFRVLVICPKSTVLNWYEEFNRWIRGYKEGTRLKVFCFEDTETIEQKLEKLEDWNKSNKRRAGCFLLGYEAFRQLVNYEETKRRGALKRPINEKVVEQHQASIDKCLLNPGADLVVCDEGHMIKNQTSATAKAVLQIRTRRRIILTGTPIQNNLNEYFAMVNFIKPSFLGTEKEFNNRYATPIKNGQHKDSSGVEIKQMKRRAFVLHQKLSPFVQRKEASILKEFLPDKHEYVLFIPLTPVQENLYQKFLDEKVSYEGANGGKTLIPDYTFLRKIWTHPRVLQMAWNDAKAAKNKKQNLTLEKVMKQFERDDCEEFDDGLFDIGNKNNSVLDDWWRKHLTTAHLDSLMPSLKLQALLQILQLCRANGEKCLVFSGFVAVLNVVEFFLHRIDTQENNPNAEAEGLTAFKGQKWIKGRHYYRLDGKTPKTERHRLITRFNDPKEKDIVAFLISARAGGQGINLIGANRVIILDTSWNPSNDQQNIFRIYRLGQKRPCFVYRLLAMGTMEERVYSRSVTKQAMSFRVVDKQQIDRHYNTSDLSELYTLTPTNMDERPTPTVPVDSLLAHLLRNFPHLIYKYHEHDSLLENKPEQDLTEEEKREAWDAFEREEQIKESGIAPGMLNFNPLAAYNYLPSQYNQGQFPPNPLWMNQRTNPYYPFDNMALWNLMSSSLGGNPMDYSSLLQGNPINLASMNAQAGLPSNLEPTMNSLAQLCGTSIPTTSPNYRSPGPSPSGGSMVSPAISSNYTSAGPSTSTYGARTSRQSDNPTSRGRGRPRNDFEGSFVAAQRPKTKSPTIIEIPEPPPLLLQKTQKQQQAGPKQNNIGISYPKSTSTGISIHVPESITVNKIARSVPSSTTVTPSMSSGPIPAPKVAQQRPPPLQPLHRANSTTIRPSQVPRPPQTQVSRQNSSPTIRVRPSQQITQKPATTVVRTPQPGPVRVAPGQQQKPRFPGPKAGPSSVHLPSLSRSSDITLTSVKGPPTRLITPRGVHNSVTVTPVIPGSNQLRPPLGLGTAAQIQKVPRPIYPSTLRPAKPPPVPSSSIFSGGPPSKTKSIRK